MRPRMLGTMALLFLTVILTQTTFQYQSTNVKAQPSPIQQVEDTEVLISNAIEALGGLQTIQNVKTQIIMAEGNRYEPGHLSPLDNRYLHLTLHMILPMISAPMNFKWIGIGVSSILILFN
jgi:hypothetical protein